jgi:RNA polymerase sigma-70 factor (ECF subfamily)
MIAAQLGDARAYEHMIKEVDAWLRRYYARRLPYPASEDARQEALLAIHAKRHTYTPSRPFGAWFLAIARYKWIDRIRDASRYAAVSLDEHLSTTNHEEAVLSATDVDMMLQRLKPSQATAIRLVKINGLSVAGASYVTGQSVALIKINIHRGLRALTKMTSNGDPTTQHRRSCFLGGQEGSAHSCPKTTKSNDTANG